MAALGFERFCVAGHDRGARVTHRLSRDHPERIERAALLDIVPTLYRFETIDQKAATGSWHWFFLIQPRAVSRAPDRRRGRAVPAPRCSGLSARPRRASSPRLRRISALLPQPRDDPRHLRRIPRRRVDRPRPRPRRPRQEGRDAAADAVGRAQRPGQRLRHAGGMARARDRCPRPRRSTAAISSRKKSRTKPTGHCAISSPRGRRARPGPERTSAASSEEQVAGRLRRQPRSARRVRPEPRSVGLSEATSSRLDLSPFGRTWSSGLP